jgi:phage terminase small subunit
MPLTPKQQRFVELYLLDLNATLAYRDSYGVTDRVAASSGCRLLGNPNVAEAIRLAQQARSERTAIDQDYVLQRLRQNVERCMQIEPVKDKDGNPLGMFKWEPSAANGALKLLGQHLGMFGDDPDRGDNRPRPGTQVFTFAGQRFVL